MLIDEFAVGMIIQITLNILFIRLYGHPSVHCSPSLNF